MADLVSPDAARIRVYLLDDHPVFREAFATIIDAEPDMVVVGQSGTAAASLEAAVALTPNVMVIDLEIPGRDGIDVLVELRRSAPSVKRLVLSGNDRGSRVVEAFEAGAQGYLLKADSAPEVIEGIRSIASGGQPLSKRIPETLLAQSSTPPPGGGDDLLAGLTSRQREVLRLLAQGKKTREIATILGIGESTIETHRANVMKKLRVKAVAKLVHYAVRAGLVDPWTQGAEPSVQPEDDAPDATAESAPPSEGNEPA